MTDSKTKVLVLGATGFIGRNLVERLAARPDLSVAGFCHDRPPFECEGVEFVQGDLRNPDDVRSAIDGQDIVIQAAATTSGVKDIVERPFIHVTDNAVMNSYILEAVNRCRIRHFVFFSCSIMYPSLARAVKESDFTDGTDIEKRYFPAAWTKVYIEKMCAFFSSISDTRFTVVRHSNVYGPHDKFDLERSHLFGATVAKVMQSDAKSVRVWGDGSEVRDLMYVSDLVDLVETVLERQDTPFEIFNVGSNQLVSVRDLVSKVINGSSRALDIEFDRSAPSIKTSICLDTTKAAERLEWQPRVSLDSGIRRTLAWYETAGGRLTTGSAEND